MAPPHLQPPPSTTFLFPCPLFPFFPSRVLLASFSLSFSSCTAHSPRLMLSSSFFFFLSLSFSLPFFPPVDLSPSPLRFLAILSSYCCSIRPRNLVAPSSVLKSFLRFCHVEWDLEKGCLFDAFMRILFKVAFRLSHTSQILFIDFRPIFLRFWSCLRLMQHMSYICIFRKLIFTHLYYCVTYSVML